MKVSIITSCYNREETIAQAIESVILQDYPDIEYIVVDGASSDNSLEIINRYRTQIAKVISESDSGMYEGINKGIKVRPAMLSDCCIPTISLLIRILFPT